MVCCDSVGLALVDAMYQYDGSYAVSVWRAHPDRFALVKPVNPDDPAVADVIADVEEDARARSASASS